MKRFDVMLEAFPSAIKRARNELKSQGFAQVEQIYDQIVANFYMMKMR